MSGYWRKTRQCAECQRQEGYSPSGKTDRGIDESGLCSSCRAYKADPVTCQVCERPIEQRRWLKAHLTGYGLLRRHWDCPPQSWFDRQAAKTEAT